MYIYKDGIFSSTGNYNLVDQSDWLCFSIIV